jgi:uncharacterized ubiquitin-like protein YukD
MKTAMQELIYDLKLLQEKDDVKLIDIEELIEYATNSLEKEKEQIIKAADKARITFGDEFDFSYEFADGEEYYNQTYNQNK